MSNPILRSMLVLACSALLTTLVAAQSNPNMQPGSKSLSTQDRDFLDHMAKDGKGEIELSQMVASKTQNPQVKEFTQRMIHDHMALDQQLQQVMSKHGVTVPQGITSEDQQLKSKLQGMSGSELDREYMQAQVQDHEKDVKTVSEKAEHADQMQPSDPDVSELAQEALPVLKEHLELAKRVASQVGAGSQSR